MSLYLKIILILFALAYLISPVDVIPDLLLPFAGWIDDGVVIAAVYYLIRHGRLPGNLFKKKGPFAGQSKRPSDGNKDQSTSTGRTRNETGTNNNQSRNSYQKKQVPEPHEILGVRPDASREEIQAAYKQAIKKYHPDKVSHLGEDFSTLANKKFLEIQQAYETMMEKYKTD